MSAGTDDDIRQEIQQGERNQVWIWEQEWCDSGSIRDRSHEWIGSLDDESGDWNGFDNHWSCWKEDPSWNSQDWWSTEQPSSNMASSCQANASQEATNCEQSQNVAAVTVEAGSKCAPIEHPRCEAWDTAESSMLDDRRVECRSAPGFSQKIAGG